MIFLSDYFRKYLCNNINDNRSSNLYSELGLKVLKTDLFNYFKNLPSKNIFIKSSDGNIQISSDIKGLEKDILQMVSDDLSLFKKR